MNRPTVVQIVGTPIACAEGVKDNWRHLALWFADKLQGRYGQAVQVQYFDLFDPDCPPLPADAELPLVIINDEVFSRGQKLSLPAIQRHLDALGVQADS